MTRNWFFRKRFGVPVWFGPNTWQGGAAIVAVFAGLAVLLQIFKH